MRPRRAPALLLMLLLAWGLSGCGQGATSERAEAVGEAAPEAVEPAPGVRAIYVPAYSHLNGGADRRLLLAITLSVRNVDPSETVILTQVDYFDTFGHRVTRYLPEPRPLRPLETAEFSVETLDERGGSGANFLVYWEASQQAHPLLTEAIMFGHVGTGYMSFTSRGVELERPPAMDDDAAEPASSEATAPSDG